jgi:prephenate dehydratase/chorismate mutase
MDLPHIRSLIDRIDHELVRLLYQRMEYALRAGKQKTTIADPQREQQVVQQAVGASTGLIDEPFIRNIYGLIFAQSKKIQSEHRVLVGFQGESGAWGDIAIRKLEGTFVPIPFVEFGDVFAAVARDEVDFGLVPIENSLEGAVTEVNDLLVEADLWIINEAIVPIQQNLLVLPGADYREIKVVYSHPQALAQCRGFLSRNKLEPRPFYDTAGAARWLAKERPTGVAVIASPLAAQLYQLESVKEAIEDRHGNSTRFVLLSRTASEGPGGKCTITFSTAHRSGALFEVLKVFAEARINLTRIESRPARSKPGTYVFLLDLLGSREDASVQRTLEAVRNMTTGFRIVGFYPEAQP